ncbi:MAG: 4-hydroxyphenylpyruvate dioxygenase [Synechocystis sp.]|nr:4-hydroxyphenylpyruvate dioxygenase [Synechocystis sp.]
MDFDYLHLYVKDYQQASHWYQDCFGFLLTDQITTAEQITGIFQQGQITLLISAPLGQQGAIADYLNVHPPGIGEVAFQVPNWLEFCEKLAEFNLKTDSIIHPLTQEVGITFTAWGNVRHSVFPCRPITITPSRLGLTAIDHVVLNLPKADFAGASHWYQTLFDWQVQQRFSIATPHSGLYSEALMDHGGNVQFNLNCPNNPQSQIQTFLDRNHGSGIQHGAFSSQNIIQTVSQLRQNAVDFLTVPRTYYDQQRQQFKLENLDITQTINWQTLHSLGILIDQKKSHPEQILLQIFTRPLFGQSSLFWEIIDRRQQATGFGEGNFQALYEAVEASERE